MTKKYVQKFMSAIIILFLIIVVRRMIVINQEYIIKDDINNIQIKNTLDIGNKKVVLFLIDNKYIGKSILEKGSNNKYKILGTGYGNSKFYRSNIEKVGDNKYLIIVGRNYQSKISKIKAYVIGRYSDYQNTRTDMYEIPTDNNEFYIYTCKLENDLIYPYLPADLIFLNNQHEDITEELFN